MSTFLLMLLQFSILAYAVVGGVFLAFSDFIMRSLASTPKGAIGMQIINREVFRWVFMTLFIALAPLSIMMAAYGFLYIEGYLGFLMTFAGLSYFIGCFGVTVIHNVPMNNTLAQHVANTAELTLYWEITYIPRWTFWNNVRTAACILSAFLVLIGLTHHISDMGFK